MFSAGKWLWLFVIMATVSSTACDRGQYFVMDENGEQQPVEPGSGALGAADQGGKTSTTKPRISDDDDDGDDDATSSSVTSTTVVAGGADPALALFVTALGATVKTNCANSCHSGTPIAGSPLNKTSDTANRDIFTKYLNENATPPAKCAAGPFVSYIKDAGHPGSASATAITQDKVQAWIAAEPKCK